jgi:hypothetical protein
MIITSCPYQETKPIMGESIEALEEELREARLNNRLPTGCFKFRGDIHDYPSPTYEEDGEGTEIEFLTLDEWYAEAV